jgi:hypothetical protein
VVEVKNNKEKRTIFFRASGQVSEAEMRALAEKGREATDGYLGKPHFVLADMRGLNVVSPVVAQLLGEIIAYGRTHGVARCAHLSDSSVLRLQARRLARESTPHDQITIDVVSLEEAERVLEEARREFGVTGTKR